MMFQDLIYYEEEKDIMDFQILDIQIDSAIQFANKLKQKVQNEINLKYYYNTANEEINELNKFF